MLWNMQVAIWVAYLSCVTNVWCACSIHYLYATSYPFTVWGKGSFSLLQTCLQHWKRWKINQYEFFAICIKLVFQCLFE